MKSKLKASRGNNSRIKKARVVILVTDKLLQFVICHENIFKDGQVRKTVNY